MVSGHQFAAEPRPGCPLLSYQIQIIPTPREEGPAVATPRDAPRPGRPGFLVGVSRAARRATVSRRHPPTYLPAARVVRVSDEGKDASTQEMPQIGLGITKNLLKTLCESHPR